MAPPFNPHLLHVLHPFLRLVVALALACSLARAIDIPTERQREDGARLAAHLRSQRPAENLTNSGTLRIRDASGRRRELPVIITTFSEADSWMVRYEARSRTNTPVESLTVHFSADAPPRYESTTPDSATPAVQPFAGTDFWRCDLGLEFLHWPDQRVVKQELSNGRMCWALDSYNPGTNGYASVRSWVDTEFQALLRAEAYDAIRRKVKEFSTGSFRQVTTSDGREIWMLKDIRIRTEFRDTRTELIYDVPTE